MANRIDLRLKWRQGKPTFGPFVQLPAPGVPEILAYAGFDFLIVDFEHGAIDLQTGESMIRAANATGIVPIVRVLSNRRDLIGQALNLGAAGVHIPHVSTKEEAEFAVRSSKFFPLGDRGVCPFVRAARYSAGKTGYYKKANAETIVIVAVEGIEGVKNLNQILTVNGVDAIFVGPYDLSQSLGVPGQVKHELVVEKVRETCTQAANTGVAVGLFVESPHDAVHWGEQGVLYCCLDVDTAILYKACRRYVQEIKS